MVGLFLGVSKLLRSGVTELVNDCQQRSRVE